MQRIAAHLAVLTMLFLGVSPEPARADEQEHLIVSLVHLITQPSDFEGKIVLVRGYLTAGLGMRLYLTKDHAEISDSASSILIEGAAPELMKCVDAYVGVNGLFGLRDGEYRIVKTLEVSRWADPRSRSMDKAWLSTCWKREAEE